MTPDDLRSWRLRIGLREVQAAVAIGVPSQTYRNWEDGRARVPGAVETLARYIERYGPLPD